MLPFGATGWDGTTGCAEAMTMRRAKAAMNFILEWALVHGESSGVGGMY
jgi:hypothetical protein